MAAPEERFLSTEEVAERLQVDEQTVRRWIKSGKLEAVKPGREWRIPPAAFEELLESYSSPKAQAPLPLDNGEERGHYPYPWMGDSLARLIDHWAGEVAGESDPKYSHIIAVGCLDVMGSVLRMDAPGRTLQDRVPENEAGERIQVADRLYDLARRAQNQYVNSKEAEAAAMQSFEERRADMWQRTRELGA